MADVQRDRVVREFMELCRIDSPARDEAAIAAVLEARLRALGVEVRNDGRGPSTGNLIGRLPATGPGRPLLLTAHMDTVEPGRGVEPRLIDDVVCSDGQSTILGADCKAGVAAILEALRVLAATAAPHPLVEIVITWGEEINHLGARELDYSEFEARLGFCLDALCPVGTIVNEAPGYDRVRAVFKGRGAHAGVEPERGISAIVAAAHAIAAMELGRIDAETTANIGLIRGGTARNAVPSEAIVEGEARSRDALKLAAQVNHLRSCFESGARAAGAEVQVEVEHAFQAYRIGPDSPVAQLALAAGRRAGLAPFFAPTGGGSDANNFNAAGLPMVVLGIGCTGAHTVNEQIAISELVALSRHVIALIEEARDLD